MRCARFVVAALVLLAAAADPALARRDKTVFRSQAGDPEVEFDRSIVPPPIAFEAVWRFADFRAPLAGDAALGDGAIVAAAQDGVVAALRPGDGTVLWRSVLDGAPIHATAPGGDRVFQALRDGRVVALAVRDGAVLWTAALGDEPAAAPRLIDGRVVAGTVTGSLVSIAAADGTIAARQDLGGRITAPAEPAPHAVLVGTDRGVVVALDAATLAVKWRHDAGHAITSPAVHDDGRVYVAAGRDLRCLRFRSGRRLWVHRGGATTTARPFLNGPYLYLLSYDNDIHVLRKRNGHLITRVRLGHRLDVAAARAGPHLLVVPFTEASLVGLALPGLQKAGRFDLDAPGEWFTTSPLVAGDLVALGYGRSQGTIVTLAIREGGPPAGTNGPAGAPPAGPGRPLGTGRPDAASQERSPRAD